MNSDISLNLNDFKKNDILYKSFKDFSKIQPFFIKSENNIEEWFIEPQEDNLSKAFCILGIDIEKANKPQKKEGEPITITNRKTGKSMSGHWRTMSGNKVFVSGDGKIQVGPEHIKEKFSNGDKSAKNLNIGDSLLDKDGVKYTVKEIFPNGTVMGEAHYKSGEKSGIVSPIANTKKNLLSDGFIVQDKKEPQQVGKKDNVLKDKVDYFKSLDDQGKKEYLDTLKNKWIPETEKQLKEAKSDAIKKIYEQQSKFEKEQLLPAIEKEMKNENKDLKSISDAMSEYGWRVEEKDNNFAIFNRNNKKIAIIEQNNNKYIIKDVMGNKLLSGNKDMINGMKKVAEQYFYAQKKIKNI